MEEFKRKNNNNIISPFQLKIRHDELEMTIGKPAILKPESKYPSLEIKTNTSGIIEGEIKCQDNGKIMKKISTKCLRKGETLNLEFEDTLSFGRYRIDVRMKDDKSELISCDSLFFTVLESHDLPKNNSVLVHPNQAGKLVYTPDYRGNCIPDFSNVGYKGGEELIPDVPVKATVEAGIGDDTKRIQDAINLVSKMEADENGFRGAVLLKKGIYEIGSYLEINTSGVVLRGEGLGNLKEIFLDPAKNYSLEELKESLQDKKATILIATGPEMRVILRIRGKSGKKIIESSKSEIINQYVAVGARTFRVEDITNYQIGEKIIVQRTGNKEWISEIGMDQIPGKGKVQWEPFTIDYERKITAINGQEITIDAPIVNAIEQKWGGGRIFKYEDPERISKIGIENLRGISFWQINKDGVDDTRHANIFIRFDNVKNSWMEKTTAEHFFGSGAFLLARETRGITVKDSSNLIADMRFYLGPGYNRSGSGITGAASVFLETGTYTGRYGFAFAGAQLNLVKNCYGINNRHAFVWHAWVPGPNVFLDCLDENSLNWSEPHHRWSQGGLYDNVQAGFGFSIMNRLHYGSGHGWSGVNFVAWNTRSERLICEQPPTAQNWAIGHIGGKIEGPFHNWNLEKFGKSYAWWELQGVQVEPRSLYYQQLKDRLNLKEK